MWLNADRKCRGEDGKSDGKETSWARWNVSAGPPRAPPFLQPPARSGRRGFPFSFLSHSFPIPFPLGIHHRQPGQSIAVFHPPARALPPARRVSGGFSPTPRLRAGHDGGGPGTDRPAILPVPHPPLAACPAPSIPQPRTVQKSKHVITSPRLRCPCSCSMSSRRGSSSLLLNSRHWPDCGNKSLWSWLRQELSTDAAHRLHYRPDGLVDPARRCCTHVVRAR